MNEPVRSNQGSPWRDYFEAVTLGAFSFRDPEKAERLIRLITGLGLGRLFIHLGLVSLALHFPVMFTLGRLPPAELYSRIYGEAFQQMLSTGDTLWTSSFPGAAPQDQPLEDALVEDFNLFMYQNAYGTQVMLPLIFLTLGVILILQGAFYLLALLFLGLQRLVSAPLSFKERLGILAFSSTLPAFGSAIFGLWVPTVHILVFYFGVILLSFFRLSPPNEAVEKPAFDDFMNL